MLAWSDLVKPLGSVVLRDECDKVGWAVDNNLLYLCTVSGALGILFTGTAELLLVLVCGKQILILKIKVCMWLVVQDWIQTCGADFWTWRTMQQELFLMSGFRKRRPHHVSSLIGCLCVGQLERGDCWDQRLVCTSNFMWGWWDGTSAKDRIVHSGFAVMCWTLGRIRNKLVLRTHDTFVKIGLPFAAVNIVHDKLTSDN